MSVHTECVMERMQKYVALMDKEQTFFFVLNC